MDMLDDDIVYLGSRNPQSPSTARPSSQSPLTGIVLHVEKCGLVEAQRLAFNRDDMPTVQIGRRSGFDPDRRRSSDIEQEGAMFRCAVVSRKHAKIAFSDSGAAYLIDLNSHHGTYIRRPDEKYSKVIKPESPTLLHDGDVVTFGKTVGKNEEAVRPVTVRVELVYQPAASSPSSSKPSSAASLFSASPSLSHSTVTKPSSGRYGVHNSASSSSDNESYSSDMYSDVDCARSISPTPPPPAEEPAPLPPSESQNSVEAPKAKVPFNAVNILRNLLPPLHPPTPRENLPSVADIMHRYFRPTPPLLSSLFDLPQPPRSGIEESQPIGFDASQHDIYEPDVQSLRSRSESPMDLASTSPSPAPEVIVSRQLSIPPILTPVLTPIPRRAIAIDLSNDFSNADHEKIDAYKPPFVNLVELYDLPGILSHPTSPGPSTTIVDKDGVNGSGDVSDQIKVIQDTVARLEEEVVRLNNHRRKYKARFTSNTELMNQKLGEFYDKVDEANAECTMLYDKVDTIRSVDIPDIQAQVDMLEERMDKFEAIGDCDDDEEMEEQEDAYEEMEDDEQEEEADVPAHQPSVNEDEIELKAGAAKVRALIDELVVLRDNAKKEVEAELESIKAMREVAMADIERAKAALAAQALKFAADERHQASPSPISFRSGRTTPVPPSLKRKRDDTDENEDCDRDDGEFGEGNSSSEMSENGYYESELQRLAVMMRCTAEDDRMHQQQDNVMKQIPDSSPPPRKRARRVVSVVAQTATAVTIGAVVTWTALAFS